MMEIFYQYKIILVMLAGLGIYLLYSRPCRLNVCTNVKEVEALEIAITSFENGFSKQTRKHTFSKDKKKIEIVIEFLKIYSFRKRLYLPNQPISRAQPHTISIIFHYRDKKNTMVIDVFEAGDEGKIRIDQMGAGYVPHCMGSVGKRQELIFLEELQQMINRVFEDEFVVDIS
jgi:hypothetical protein